MKKHFLFSWLFCLLISPTVYAENFASVSMLFENGTTDTFTVMANEVLHGHWIKDQQPIEGEIYPASTGIGPLGSMSNQFNFGTAAEILLISNGAVVRVSWQLAWSGESHINFQSDSYRLLESHLTPSPDRMHLLWSGVIVKK